MNKAYINWDLAQAYVGRSTSDLLKLRDDVAMMMTLSSTKAQLKVLQEIQRTIIFVIGVNCVAEPRR